VKKTGLIFLAAVVFVGIVIGAAFTGAALVKAQGPTPNTPDSLSPFGRMGSMMGAGRGVMHDYMQAAIAEKLGITLEDLTAQETAGKTIWQIAEAKGLSADQTATMLQEAHTAALDKMVADGVVTQAQADLMKTNGGRMMNGRGGCPMNDGDDNGGRRGGRGWGGMMGN
jgi:hypothetical protein